MTEALLWTILIHAGEGLLFLVCVGLALWGAEAIIADGVEKGIEASGIVDKLDELLNERRESRDSDSD